MELHEESGSSMHPERPDRVRAVMARLRAAELEGRCRRLPAREATLEEVGACHIPELVEAVDLLSEQSRLQGNAGLHFSPGGPRRRARHFCRDWPLACADVPARLHCPSPGCKQRTRSACLPPGLMLTLNNLPCMPSLQTRM